MHKFKETIGTVVTAMRCSIGFCWRNNKKDTVWRVIIAVSNAILLYVSIQASGLIFNSVQAVLVTFKGRPITLNDPALSPLLWPLVLMVSIILITVVVGRLNGFYTNRWRQRLRFSNQRELNEHRATLDVARIRSKEYDDLEKRIQELPTSWQTRIWFSESMLELFTMVISFVLFGMSLLWYKPIYALVLLVTAIPMVLAKFQLVSMWWNLFQSLVPVHKQRSVLEKPYHRSDVFVQAQMFNQMPMLRKEIDINIGTVIESYDKIRSVSMKKEMIVSLVSAASLCAVIAHAIWQTISVTHEIGTLTIVIAAARTFQGSLESIVSLIAEQWNSVKGIILIEKDFLGLRPVMKTAYPVIPNFDVTPRIRFENVSFTYPESDMQALNNVSFEIKAGSKVAIVGKSGNGKSTIQALLMRHYDPTSGSVFVEDINLKSIEPRVWSKIASGLTQEYAVLERRIGDEIASSRLGEPVDKELVKASARFAHFEEVVDADPNGYDSQIGVEFGGRKFSGGECQRLALARAHYRGTPILVLDEPDAKLDPESAQRVIDQVFMLKGVTVVIITHHVSRAERCDQVIVMGKGEVAEQGTHDELMALGGTYASMYTQDKKRLGPES